MFALSVQLFWTESLLKLIQPPDLMLPVICAAIIVHSFIKKWGSIFKCSYGKFVRLIFFQQSWVKSESAKIKWKWWFKNLNEKIPLIFGRTMKIKKRGVIKKKYYYSLWFRHVTKQCNLFVCTDWKMTIHNLRRHINRRSNPNSPSWPVIDQSQATLKSAFYPSKEMFVAKIWPSIVLFFLQKALICVFLFFF